MVHPPSGNDVPVQITIREHSTAGEKKQESAGGD
jgi:hypothetical protein